MDAVFVGLALAAAFGLAPSLVLRRLAVDGESMAPALRPGDRLLALRLPRRLTARVLRPGRLVAAMDPRVPRRLIVKRVASLGADGSVMLVGDNASQSTDSRTFGPVSVRDLRGVVVYRYWPHERAGALRLGTPGSEGADGAEGAAPHAVVPGDAVQGHH